MIEILSTGLLNTVQDRGRTGLLSSGVSLGGAMDRPAFEAANLLVGNDAAAAGIEVALFPFRLRVDEETALAVTGADCSATVDGIPCPPWWALVLRPGQTLVLSAPRSGARAYVAFAGGIDVPRVLGSRATDVRGGFGGLDGRGLSRGDRLPLGPVSAQGRALAGAGLGAVPPERALPQGGAQAAAIMIRVLPAAEYPVFTDAARGALTEADWSVTTEANRMGYRLSGPALSLTQPLELLSHGIVPGTVQVPPAGQPIIQLADANTCGGYPKIATVIEADLWRLAQAPVGSTLRFTLVDHPTAVEALRGQAAWAADVRAMRSLLDG